MPSSVVRWWVRTQQHSATVAAHSEASQLLFFTGAYLFGSLFLQAPAATSLWVPQRLLWGMVLKGMGLGLVQEPP